MEKLFLEVELKSPCPGGREAAAAAGGCGALRTERPAEASSTQCLGYGNGGPLQGRGFPTLAIEMKIVRVVNTMSACERTTR